MKENFMTSLFASRLTSTHLSNAHSPSNIKLDEFMKNFNNVKDNKDLCIQIISSITSIHYIPKSEESRCLDFTLKGPGTIDIKIQEIKKYMLNPVNSSKYYSTILSRAFQTKSKTQHKLHYFMKPTLVVVDAIFLNLRASQAPNASQFYNAIRALTATAESFIALLCFVPVSPLMLLTAVGRAIKTSLRTYVEPEKIEQATVKLRKIINYLSIIEDYLKRPGAQLTSDEIAQLNTIFRDQVINVNNVRDIILTWKGAFNRGLTKLSKRNCHGYFSNNGRYDFGYRVNFINNFNYNHFLSISNRTAIEQPSCAS